MDALDQIYERNNGESEIEGLPQTHDTLRNIKRKKISEINRGHNIINLSVTDLIQTTIGKPTKFVTFFLKENWTYFLVNCLKVLGDNKPYSPRHIIIISVSYPWGGGGGKGGLPPPPRPPPPLRNFSTIK